MGDQKHSLNLIGPRQGQKPPVSFYNIYKFLKHNMYINFYIMKTKNIVSVLTLVLIRVCQSWVMYHDDTVTTLPELMSPKQP